MKKYVLILCLIFGLTNCNFAAAHFSQSDGSIKVVMHIDPDDDPIVSSPTFLSFEVISSKNNFDAAKCDCSLEIYNGDKQLLNGTLPVVSSNPGIFDFRMPFTFPARAVYSITMSGRPKIAGAFQSFKVSYNFRVTRLNPSSRAVGISQRQEDAGNNPSLAVILIILVLTFCGLIFTIIKVIKLKSKK